MFNQDLSILKNKCNYDILQSEAKKISIRSYKIFIIGENIQKTNATTHPSPKSHSSWNSCGNKNQLSQRECEHQHFKFVFMYINFVYVDLNI